VYREPTTRGVVRAWGPDTSEVKNGDNVVFRKFVATIVTVGEAQWLLLRESDILCRVE